MNVNNKYRKSNRMLLDERPLVLLPSLAAIVGADAAIAIQQLHFHLANPNNGYIHDDEQWIFKTYEAWRKDDFPFWSERTIRRIFTDLEKRGLIVSCQPEGRDSRRKHYRIDYDALTRTRAGCGQKRRINAARKGASSLSETTCTETTKSFRAHADARAGNGFGLKLPYPKSEAEMYATLEELGVEIDPDRDGNFFKQMVKAGWKINGKPVFDWVETYRARLEHVYNSTG